MEDRIMKETDWTDLLIEVSDAYNVEIDRLEKENQRLSRLLSVSLLFRLERKCTAILQDVNRSMIKMVKQAIIFWGLKEYVKKTMLYQRYNKRQR